MQMCDGGSGVVLDAATRQTKWFHFMTQVWWRETEDREQFQISNCTLEITKQQTIPLHLTKYTAFSGAFKTARHTVCFCTVGTTSSVIYTVKIYISAVHFLVLSSLKA